LLACALCLLAPATAAAAGEWQFKPFIGASFAGNTTLIDVESASGQAHTTVGMSTLLIGEVLGIEADFGTTPGFFSAGEALVARSSVTTLTGNVVIALPQHLTQYTLRPYFVGGGGLMHVRNELFLDPLPIGTTRLAIDVGGGATGFLTRRVGVNWDVRYFHTLGDGEADRGLSFGPERLSFWRASMALAIRR
jgi:hypothetical protein